MKKTDKIKERLNNHLELLEKLKTLNLEIQHIYGTIKSPSFSGMPGGNGGARSTEEERLYLRKAELEEKVARKQAEIDRDWAELEEMVECLSPIETLIMNLRYRYGEEWDDVCAIVFGKRSDYEIELEHYENRMYKIHGRALCSLADMMVERATWTA